MVGRWEVLPSNDIAFSRVNRAEPCSWRFLALAIQITGHLAASATLPSRLAEASEAAFATS